MSELERAALQSVIDQSAAAGIDVPDAVQRAFDHLNHTVCAGGQIWAAQHPDEDEWPLEATICCEPAIYYGQTRCTCWEPVFDVDQADPVPLTGPEQLAAQPRMCGDCAYRRDSPERSDGWLEVQLLALPSKGAPFWCHEGMRRPVVYRHPALGDVPGDPADWRPPVVGGVPYRADGRVGLLCGGWAARAASVLATANVPMRGGEMVRTLPHDPDDEAEVAAVQTPEGEPDGRLLDPDDVEFTDESAEDVSEA